MAARAGLRCVSWPYRLGVWWRNRAFDRGRRTVHRATVPVVSIGNLTLGVTSQDWRHHTGVYDEWNINLEYQLPGTILITPAYVGSKGTKLN